MRSLARGAISSRASRDIKNLVRPLSVGYATPERQDLTRFWVRVERALVGLCPDFSLEELDRTQISALGPHILGDTVWERVEHEEFKTWEEFKAAIQADYGLTDT